MEFLKVIIVTTILILPCVGSAKSELLRLSYFKNREKCNISKSFVYLNNAEVNKLETELNTRPISKIIRRFTLFCINKKSKVYIISDKVRTHFQTLLVEVKNSKVVHVEILRFEEPKKYAPPTDWYKLNFLGIKENEVGRVDGLTGATLTYKSNKKLILLALKLEGK